MINIDELKRFCDFVANKSQAGINPTISQYNIAFKKAQIEWVNNLYGNSNTYQPGTGIAKSGYQQTIFIADQLRFLIKRSVIQTDATGKMPFPDDYMHISSIRYSHKQKVNCEVVTTEVDVKLLNDSEVGNILSSKIVAPSYRYPACQVYSTVIQMYPRGIRSVIFTYLRQPIAPVWGFTVVNSRPVYNSAASVNLEAPEEAFGEIANRVLSLLGIHIREPELLGYAETMKQQGN